MSFAFSVPTPSGPSDFELEPGETIIFVGANGGGKTRLTVPIEHSLGLQAHRISAHRALNLNPTVSKISEKKALAGIRIGHANEDSLMNIGRRAINRWGQKDATHLLRASPYRNESLGGFPRSPKSDSVYPRRISR